LPTEERGCPLNRVVPGNPLDDAKLLGTTLASLLRSNAMKAVNKSLATV